MIDLEEVSQITGLGRENIIFVLNVIPKKIKGNIIEPDLFSYRQRGFLVTFGNIITNSKAFFEDTEKSQAWFSGEKINGRTPNQHLMFDRDRGINFINNYLVGMLQERKSSG